MPPCQLKVEDLRCPQTCAGHLGYISEQDKHLCLYCGSYILLRLLLWSCESGVVVLTIWSLGPYQSYAYLPEKLHIYNSLHIRGSGQSEAHPWTPGWKPRKLAWNWECRDWDKARPGVWVFGHFFSPNKTGLWFLHPYSQGSLPRTQGYI